MLAHELSLHPKSTLSLRSGAQLHHLRWPVEHMASSSCTYGINANSPSAYASYDVLVHQLAVLRPASFRPTLAGKPLPFASSYRLLTTWFSTVFFLQRTFTSLVHAHAGRIQGKSADTKKLRFIGPLLLAYVSEAI